jgi:hypothetical protein
MQAEIVGGKCFQRISKVPKAIQYENLLQIIEYTLQAVVILAYQHEEDGQFRIKGDEDLRRAMDMCTSANTLKLLCHVRPKSKIKQYTSVFVQKGLVTRGIMKAQRGEGSDIMAKIKQARKDGVDPNDITWSSRNVMAIQRQWQGMLKRARHGLFRVDRLPKPIVYIDGDWFSAVLLLPLGSAEFGDYGFWGTIECQASCRVLSQKHPILMEVSERKSERRGACARAGRGPGRRQRGEKDRGREEKRQLVGCISRLVPVHCPFHVPTVFDLPTPMRPTHASHSHMAHMHGIRMACRTYRLLAQVTRRLKTEEDPATVEMLTLCCFTTFVMDIIARPDQYGPEKPYEYKTDAEKDRC